METFASFGERTMLARALDSSGAIEVVKSVREGLEPAKRGVEQPHRAAERAALHVVIRRRELDEALVELDEVTIRFEPELLPRLMRLPELERVEVIDAAREHG